MSSVPVFIGLRYTRAKRRNQFISFVSGFSLLGMTLGVMALIIVLSVLNGFDRELKGRILSVIPHGFVSAERPITRWPALAEQVATVPGVVAGAPYISGFGMASLGDSSEMVQIQGILPEAERMVSVVDQHMLQGELSNLQPGEWGIVVGRILARFLNARVGDQITILTPRVSTTPIGPVLMPRRFKIVGIFEVGADVDKTLAMIHIDSAQKLFRYRDSVEGLHLKVRDIYAAGPIMSRVADQLGGDYQVRDWSQTQGSLFQAVKMEKILIMLMLMIIVAIAAFNIVSSLVLMVADKRSDIAVLRTLGLTARQIMAIFVVQGSTVGLFGILLGVVLGVLGAFYVGDVVSFLEGAFGQKIFDPGVYYISELPSHWMLSDTLIVVSVAIVMSLLATLPPAIRAARIAPAEALRYE
ncbi:lipoprotein-releasing ABC transporter permease subunit [Gilvimarinus sp. F26214L]|uniref:lipoprotein-releasing ABC transporter permease subunit n=1 Tax=Gilvimarinus sp. DZF01 TaxID=3461371 RepID=UPI0040453CD8